MRKHNPLLISVAFLLIVCLFYSNCVPKQSIHFPYADFQPRLSGTTPPWSCTRRTSCRTSRRPSWPPSASLPRCTLLWKLEWSRGTGRSRWPRRSRRPGIQWIPVPSPAELVPSTWSSFPPWTGPMEQLWNAAPRSTPPSRP